MYKKGEFTINKFTATIITFIVVIFLLFAGGVLIQGVIDSNDPLINTKIDNETQFANVTSAFNLSNYANQDEGFVLVNNSNIISSGNYTITYIGVTGKTIAQINWTGNGSVADYVNDSINLEVGVNYTAMSGEDTAAINISKRGQQGVMNISQQLPLVGTALILGFLITLIVVVVGFVIVKRLRNG